MMPSILDPQTASAGEREVYRRLQDEPQGAEWTAIHSLNIAHHTRQITGEADFVVVVPLLGVLCLEIKAHSEIRRENGLWYYGHDKAPDPRGPFRQASEAMHSIRARVVAQNPALGSVLWWSAVVFPYAPFRVLSDEWHQWQVIDSQRFRSGPLTNSIVYVLDHARQFVATVPSAKWFQPGAGQPTAAQCKAIALAARPDFEFYESPRSRSRRIKEEVKHFTEEQYSALDAMAAMPRVVFAGPAGTGKTLLAVETARRASLAGRRVLLLCFNRLLSRWLRSEVEPLGEKAWVGTLHSFMLHSAGIASPPSDDAHFWQRLLPEAAIDRLLGKSAPALYDELIIDEAQDMLSDPYLDLLDLSLAGGLSAGRWRLFGDFERQTLYETDLSVEDFTHRRAAGTPTYLLRTNCRNVPRISSLVRLLAGLEPNYSKVLRPDNGVEPEVKYYSSLDAQVSLLASSLDSLLAERFGPDDIVVLSPRSGNACSDALTNGKWKGRLCSAESAAAGQIKTSTVHSFKGLESAAVVLTDVESIKGPRAQALFYTAITRAQDRLIVLVDSSVRPDLISVLTGVPSPA
jgi:DNA polymerase III delta prime subunit